MNRVLWILQGLLAVVYLLHGFMMISPPASLLDQMNNEIGSGFRMFIGVAEVLAAIGLTLPGVTHIMPWFTAFAAAGLMIVMASAIVFHVSRGEIAPAVVCLVLLGLVTYVAYMRWRVVPLLPRRALAH